MSTTTKARRPATIAGHPTLRRDVLCAVGEEALFAAAPEMASAGMVRLGSDQLMWWGHVIPSTGAVHLWAAMPRPTEAACPHCTAAGVGEVEPVGLLEHLAREAGWTPTAVAPDTVWWDELTEVEQAAAVDEWASIDGLIRDAHAYHEGGGE